MFHTFFYIFFSCVCEREFCYICGISTSESNVLCVGTCTCVLRLELQEIYHAWKVPFLKKAYYMYM